MRDPFAKPTPNTTETILYPDWQVPCRAVMIETEPAKVREKLKIAEAAVAKREKELASAPEDDPERLALKEESEAMRLAVAETFADPAVKKS